MQFTYNEIIDIVDLNYIPSKRISYSVPPSVYQIVDINKTLEYILPDKVKVNINIGDIKLKSNLKINQTLIFTKKSFFYTILGFVASQLWVLADIDGFVQVIPCTYKSYISIKITGIEKVRLKCECFMC